MLDKKIKRCKVITKTHQPFTFSIFFVIITFIVSMCCRSESTV